MTIRRKTTDEILEAADGNIRFRLAQAELEAAALRGEFGLQRQLVAMSAKYNALKNAGQDDEARALKAQAIALAEAEA